MASDDQIPVMAEWYDLFIPPRHHMAVVTIHQARTMVRAGMLIGCYHICPEMLRNEQAEAQRISR